MNSMESYEQYRHLEKIFQRDEKRKGPLHMREARLCLERNGKTIDEVTLSKEIMVLGREKGDIIISEPGISSTHCKIQRIGEDYHLFDLNSTNGTYVNESRVVKARLCSGDLIQLGSATFKFTIAECSADAGFVDISADLLPLPAEDISRKIDNLLKEEKHRAIQTVTLALDITYPEGDTENVIINDRECIIGRLSPFGRLSVDDELSRKHAKISIDKTGKIWIEDLGSTNGIIVNEKKISAKSILALNNKIIIGKEKFHVRYHLAPEK